MGCMGGAGPDGFYWGGSARGGGRGKRQRIAHVPPREVSPQEGAAVAGGGGWMTRQRLCPDARGARTRLFARGDGFLPSAPAAPGRGACARAGIWARPTFFFKFF